MVAIDAEAEESRAVDELAPQPESTVMGDPRD